MESWMWIVIVVVVALILLALVFGGARRKNKEVKHDKAESMRRVAAEDETGVQQREADAARADAEARRAQAEADRQAANAQHQRAGAQGQADDAAAARRENDDALRKADEMDPEVGRKGRKGRDDGPEASAAAGTYATDQPQGEGGVYRDDAYRGDAAYRDDAYRGQAPRKDATTYQDARYGDTNYRDTSYEETTPGAGRASADDVDQTDGRHAGEVREDRSGERGVSDDSEGRHADDGSADQGEVPEREEYAPGKSDKDAEDSHDRSFGDRIKGKVEDVRHHGEGHRST